MSKPASKKHSRNWQSGSKRETDTHFSIERYIISDTVTRTPNCQLAAIDFLCLRSGKLLSDTVMDEALATFCMKRPDSTTISALV
jgi:hypothetical protein